jgi:hypothetical protein
MSMKKHLNDYREGHSLLRLLESKVGKLWNDVYSEICSFADVRSKNGYDLRRRVSWCVDFDVVMDECGIPHRFNKYGSYPVRGLYIHPETGILCKSIPKSYNVIKSNEQEKDLIALEDGSFYEKIDGCWFHLWIEKKKYTYPVELVEVNGEFKYTVGYHILHIDKKRQLSKKEIQKDVIPLLYTGTNKNYLERMGGGKHTKYENWVNYFSPKGYL